MYIDEDETRQKYVDDNDNDDDDCDDDFFCYDDNFDE